MILAVLETRCGLGFGGRDVYLNVAGGLKISEPAADLAVAAALVSAMFDVALPEDCVAFGEIALSGDVRPVSRADARLKEAEKLGFSQAFVPRAATSSGKNDIETRASQTKRLAPSSVGVAGRTISHAADLIEAITGETNPNLPIPSTDKRA
jgi:DNA repair protein RadA/Sms